MDLFPRGRDKPLIFIAGLLAEHRSARDLELSYPEAVMLISAALLKGAYDGHNATEPMHYSTTPLNRE